MTLRGTRAHRLRPRLGIAATHQSHEFLGGRLVTAPVVAALLRHRAGNPRPFGPKGIWLVDPRGGPRSFNRQLAGFAGRVIIANIDVAITHDCHPLLEVRHNARLHRKVASGQGESAYLC
jgi:hypothetical protein